MKLKLLLVLLGCILLTGCNSIDHRSQSAVMSSRDATTEILVERGHPNAVIDGLGWVVGTPTKLALWDRRADNHDVSPQTEAALVQYMEQNGLRGSMVRINQYDPWGEWERLTSNKRIHPGWRYTVGTYNHLKYVLLPGRVFGGDWYNPFTDSTHVYSDIAPLVISRAAYAKDIRAQKQPGTYAATQELPFINMVHTTRATNDALKYAAQYGTAQEQAEANRILSPDYGSSWGGQIASVLPFGAPFGRLAGAVVGHATNQLRKRDGSNSSQPLNEYHCDTADIDWNRGDQND
tara:strand:- start:10653 stop:11528 length:876 start_codon:yes stop_codon:yes gene_type:complete